MLVGPMGNCPACPRAKTVLSHNIHILAWVPMLVWPLGNCPACPCAKFLAVWEC